MPHQRTPLWTVAVLATLLAPSPARGASEHPGPRAWVLDARAGTLVLLALPGGERIASLPMGDAPEFLLRSPDGSRLIVLDRGPGTDKGSRGFEAKGKSVATLFDPAARAVVARVELGWGISRQGFVFSEDGHRLTLLCPGFEHDDPEKALPRELVSIDVVTGAETGRVTVEPGSVPVGTDGETLALMWGELRGSGPDFGRGRLSIVDLAGPVLKGSVGTGGWSSRALDGQYVYLLHRGWPNRNARLHRNGSIHVYSVEPVALETVLDAGSSPRGLYHDTRGGQLLVASDGPVDSGGSAHGRLLVLRGTTVVATLSVADNPRLVQRAGDLILVVGEEDVTLVDLAALEVVGTIPLREGEDPLVDSDAIPTELDLSSDERHAFINYGLHNRVVVLDLDTGKAVGSVKTGPRNKALISGLSIGLGAAGFMAGWPGAVLGTTGTAVSVWNRRLGFKQITPTMLVVPPEGDVAYALNSQGMDVAVVDAGTANRLAHVSMRGHELRLLGDGSLLAAVSGSGIHLLETESNTRIDEIYIRDLQAVESTPDRAYVVALGERQLVCLSASTGDVRANLWDFKKAVALVLDGGGPGPSAPLGASR